MTIQILSVVQVADLNAKLEQEKREALEKTQKQSGGASGGGSKVKGNWTEEEVSILIKAVNLFPAGTSQRWDIKVIAQMIFSKHHRDMLLY